MKRHVLVVDDDTSMLALLRFLLEKNDYLVNEAQTYADALGALQTHVFDCALLDVQLPDKSGLMLLQYIRNHSSNPAMPVVMVTGRNDEIDTVLGLEMGADDYISKPVKKRELVARLEVIFRRIELDNRRSGKVIPIGHLNLHTAEKKLTGECGSYILAPKEYTLLFLLASQPGKIFGREELLDKVWGDEVALESRTVDVHIRRLRKKISVEGNEPDIIETIRGYGYRFVR